MTEPLLTVEGLRVHFTQRSPLRASRSIVRAVDDVSFAVGRGETLAVVGESGSGKTTLARAVCGLVRPGAGRVVLDGTDLVRARGAAGRKRRRAIQMVFQDPYGSLHPRQRIGDQVAEAWRINPDLVPAGNRQQERDRLLELVGLNPADARRYPHEFSGGQRQRIGIARALAARPTLLICDEPVSALDVSIQAQVVNLLLDLQEDLGLSYLFISHDIALVRRLAHRVAVMYEGRLVETGPVPEVLSSPTHPYTRDLLAAVPTVGDDDSAPQPTGGR